MNIPIAERAMLGRLAGPAHTDWDGTVPDRVRVYQALPPNERAGCYLETITPVIFDDDLPPITNLTADKIERLAERLAVAGEL